MAVHNEMGKIGEQMARRHMEQLGFEILETNWRVGHLEADIIAQKDGMIVFVEVKTRANEVFGEPEDFVDRRKQRAYIRLADTYVQQHNLLEEVRFDIISVVINASGCQINHLPNAYTTIG